MATLHPSVASPIMRSIGTRTPWKKVSHISCTPLANVNGRRVRPGASVSTNSAASPRCRLSGGPVRTRTRSRVARCPWLVHTFWPSTTIRSPSSAPRGAQGGKVAPRVRLGERLRPGFFAGQETREEGLGQRGRIPEQSRSDHLNRQVGVGKFEAGAAQLVVVGGTVPRAPSEAAERLRPSEPLPPGLPQRCGTARGPRRWGPRATPDRLRARPRVPRASNGNFCGSDRRLRRRGPPTSPTPRLGWLHRVAVDLLGPDRVPDLGVHERRGESLAPGQVE